MKGIVTILQAATLALLACGALADGKVVPREFTIEENAPGGLKGLIDPKAKIEVLGDRYGLTEGGVWIDDADGGHLLFADLISNVIYRWDRKNGTTVFLENAGYTGDDLYKAGTQTLRGRMHVLLIGPNGIALDPEGRLVWCAITDRKVVRLEKDGTRTVIADRYEGKRFSGPNDLAYRSDGMLYFTDTIWGMRGAREKGKESERELPFTGIFTVKDGKLAVALDDKALGAQPNGIAFSPDEKHLYANADFKNIMRYDVQPDGSLTNGKVFVPGEGSDGIKVDVKGNVYTTAGAGPGEVRITSPEGVRLATLKLPLSDKEPRAQVCTTNVAFGDADSKGLYIMACEVNFRVQMLVEGVRVKTKY